MEGSQVALPLPAAGGDEGDEYYENPLEVIRDFGTNPLMERAQIALTSQLKEAQYRLKIEKAEKAEELKRQSVDRIVSYGWNLV